MSEDRNDIRGGNASMDNSEFETSGMIEVKIEMQSTQIKMSSSEFETRLTEFFTKHKKSKLHLVSRIVFEFKGYEDIVLEHLNNKYVYNIAPEKPKKKIENIAPEEHGAHHKTVESPKVEKPKSKSKLIIIIVIIVVVLAGLGVAGFLMKDQIMGMLGKGHNTEQEAPKAKTESENKPAATPPKEEAAPKPEVTDSTKTATAATDSVKIN